MKAEDRKKDTWRPTPRKADLGPYAPDNELSDRIDDLLELLVRDSGLKPETALAYWSLRLGDFSRWRGGDDRKDVVRFTRAVANALTRKRTAAPAWRHLPPDQWAIIQANLGKLIQGFIVRLELSELNEIKTRLMAANLQHAVDLRLWATHDDVIGCVGIGALNIDHIAAQSETALLSADAVERANTHFLFDTERVASDDKFDRVKAEFKDLIWKEVMGGSAFNAVRAITAAGDLLSCGYIGSIGKDVPPFRDWFEHARVAGMIVEAKDLFTARCLSFVFRGKRSLLPTEGANSALVDGMLKYRERMIDFLARAKHAHITSIFDPRAPGVIADLIVDARRRNPSLTVSVDPGFVWCKAASDDESIWRLLKEADLLFLDDHEFGALGYTSKSDEEAAGDILGQLGRAAAVVVQKRIDRTLIYKMLDGAVVTTDVVHEEIAVSNIEDSTGAGDAFAAGCLIGFLLPDMSLRDGVVLGARFAREKLRALGDEAFSAFPRLLFDARQGRAGA